MINKTKENIKKILGLGIKEIRSHPALGHLKMTEEEIWRHVKEIDQVIKSWENCGESKKFCNSIEPHYSLRRNQDDQLILEVYDCEKAKCYSEMPESLLNAAISRAIEDRDFIFNLKDVRRELERTTDAKMVNFLGDKNYNLGNEYITSEYPKSYVPHFFHAILIGLETKIVSSQSLKQALYQKQFNNFDQGDDGKYSSYLESPFLIITDLGLENDYWKNIYYLDLFPEFLNNRKVNQRNTYIFTPLRWEDIMEFMRKSNYFQRNPNRTSPDLIQEIKMKRLDRIMGELFSKKQEP